MFILAVDSGSRAGQRVRDVLDVLLRAARRGVAVRLIVNDFRNDPGQPTLNLVAAHHLAHGGAGVRLYADEGHPSIHSKYLLVDDDVAVIGSGNWSAGGLGANLEAAVRVDSAPLVRVLRRRFDNDWAGAVELEPLP
jgi:phosphatidylserine/phosphatidylglycerophosphate/cardiolipin synthase-like enzyme